VPPPENAIATTVSPPTFGGVPGGTIAALDATGKLIGSLKVAAHAARNSASVATAAQYAVSRIPDHPQRGKAKSTLLTRVDIFCLRSV
jgi:hypothetical protein